MPWQTLDKERYRVFKAEPLLAIHHDKEVKWHEKHIRQLQRYKAKPHRFYKHHPHKSHEERARYYDEHVTKALPFHTELVDAHTKRKNLLSQFFTKSEIKKLRKLSTDRTALPDYLVYDKLTGTVFFASKQPTTHQQLWAHEIEQRKLAQVKTI